MFLSRAINRAKNTWNSYVNLINRYPCASDSLNTCVLYVSGDVIAQLVLERRSIKDFDIVRSARFALVGGALAGPGMHFWYRGLDRRFEGGNATIRTVKKTAADQLFFLPLYLVIYIVAMGALRGERANCIRAKLGRDMGPVLIASYCIWPPVQMVNFALIPIHHRVLLINFFSLFWNTYIGWKAEQTSDPNNPEADKLERMCR